MFYAGRDVSDEIRTSPVEVGAVAFEDAAGARADLSVQRPRPRARRDASNSGARRYRRRVEPGRMLEVRIGEPVLVDAMPTHEPREAAAPVWLEPAHRAA